MIDVDLFLGFQVDPLFARQLETVNPTLLSQFIGGSEEYLKDYYHNDLRFLGKNLGNITTLPQLVLIEKNIYSLLQRLVPDFPYDEAPLYLFPIRHTHHD